MTRATVGSRLRRIAAFSVASVLWVLLGAIVHAQEPPGLPPDPAAAPTPNAGPVTVSLTAGGIATLSGEDGTQIDPTGFLSVDGPLVVGKTPLARVYARLGIATLPGQTFDLARAETFRSARAELGLYHVVGRLEVGEQEVLTGLVVEAGFDSRLPTSTTRPLQRLVRHYGAGLRFEERRSGAWVVMLYGRDEAAGDRGYGQWILAGAVPVLGTKGAVIVTGSATLSAGPAREGLSQRDVLRLGVTLDLGAALRAVRGGS